ncbi:MAG: nitronate monooxygenase [Crocinitomicaceae bacterium]|nr:nitronate monooxygenase [Crocinitomicaceae bacterium]MDP4739151.1 nitronate monooxygenase [Crocinitomicaceae bacterium]MDP4800037.1 nitronate monooxygenase [Crocinitomicaceae bacterium]MDP4807288.1 nitronate monooxygenase [Crocinitomicaceae bacterium]MDP4867596.1 nitronate monooxygenase [Crocinitomicaceae bacterium]
MNTTNRICSLFHIQYPLIQGGMIWCAGWELASAVSNAGGLGLLGAGSMYPDVLDAQISKCKANTDKPFGVNLPLLYPNIEEHIATIIKHKVPIVFTSAGNPKTWTETLKKEGITVVHVVSSVKFALKAQAAGVDAVVAEGFEAGGHNGRDETTTLCLIPMVRNAIHIPLIAAGGIGDGRALLAVMNLGADGAQVGSRFVASEESSAHQNFKQAVIESQEGDTLLTLKELTPVRLLRNPFFDQLMAAYQNGASADALTTLLGRGRAKKGMFEGDLAEGELEIGQIAGAFNEILPAATIVEQFIKEYNQALAGQHPFSL